MLRQEFIHRLATIMTQPAILMFVMLLVLSGFCTQTGLPSATIAANTNPDYTTVKTSSIVGSYELVDGMSYSQIRLMSNGSGWICQAFALGDAGITVRPICWCFEASNSICIKGDGIRPAMRMSATFSVLSRGKSEFMDVTIYSVHGGFHKWFMRIDAIDNMRKEICDAFEGIEGSFLKRTNNPSATPGIEGQPSSEQIILPPNPTNAPSGDGKR